MTTIACDGKSIAADGLAVRRDMIVSHDMVKVRRVGDAMTENLLNQSCAPSLTEPPGSGGMRSVCSLCLYTPQQWRNLKPGFYCSGKCHE